MSASVPYVPLPGVQLDPINGGEFAGQYSAASAGVFSYAGNLYSCLTAINTEIFSSSTGADWNHLDAAHEPTNVDNCASCYDGAHTLYVVYQVFGDDFVLTSFNLATGLWSGTIATYTSSGFTCQSLIVRADGSLVVFGTTPVTGSNSGVSAAIWSGVWTTIDVGAGMIALTDWDTTVTPSQMTSLYDGTYSFLFWVANSSSATGWSNQNCFFVRVNSDNSLHNFFTFPNQLATTPPDLESPNWYPIGVPCKADSVLFVPVSRNNPAYLPTLYTTPFYYTSPDNGGTWTESTVSLDPTVTGLAANSCQFPPYSFYDSNSNTIYVVYARLVGFGSEATQIRYCTTTPNSGSPSQWVWACSTIANIASYPTEASFSFPSVQVISSPANVMVSSDLSDGINLTAWWLGDFFPLLSRLNVNVGSSGGVPSMSMPFCLTQPRSKCKVFLGEICL